MQNKKLIEQLLLSAGVRPNKRFGQHFLIDLNLMRLLIDSADIQKNDVVLEVGPGTGSLTEAICEKAGHCIAVEIDSVLAEIAYQQLAGKSNFEIIAADVLENKYEINPTVIDAINNARKKFDGRFLLISNLPYVAGTPLMLNLITGQTVADAMFVTVQKEVADRMIAGSGSKDYGILSILLSATGDLKHIRTLKPSVFWPQPQVNSAIVSYVRNTEKINKIKSIEMLSAVSSGLLQHRRKMLKGCCELLQDDLKNQIWPDIFAKCNIDSSLRPDHLSPDQFVLIANLCCES